jgi:GT2 family glycosyltransferase
MAARDITLSVVSHRQNALVNLLLADLARHCAERIAIVVTENAPDETALALEGLGCPVERIRNAAPRGFGANHNAAFARCRTPWFCVANPDVRLGEDPFPPLVEALARAAVVGPLVRSPAGSLEDSARRFPTVSSLLRKAVSGPAGPDYPWDRGAQEVDWVAGMFMLFRAEDYRALGGFDERYFLYYEDVDICRRLRRAGKRVLWEPRSGVIHDARRGSRRDPALLRHHLSSLLRFLRG